MSSYFVGCDFSPFQVHSETLITRGSSEYKAALEVELWKEITEQDFLANLRRKEDKILSELSRSHKEEQARYESEVRTCKRSADDLLKQYKTKLGSLEKREKKHAQNEMVFERRQSSFSQERAAKLDDVKQKSNYRGDFLSIELETVINKIKAAEIMNSRLVQRVESMEKAISFKEIELTNSSQLSQSQIPVDLQDELCTAKIEYAKSKERLSKITVSKERYKAKLKSVLDDLSKCKQAPHQFEIPATTLSHLTAPAHSDSPLKSNSVKANDEENNDVAIIKSDLQNIIESMSGHSQKTPSVPSHQVESEIAKLISERNTLLNTGVYLSDDFIIEQLDGKIKKLLHLKEQSSYH